MQVGRSTLVIHILAITLFFCLHGGGEAQGTREVVAEGVAAILQGNVGVARDQALDDALRKAIEQGIGMVITTETQVKNAQLLNDEIYGRTRGYVQQYTILQEGQAGAIMRLRIQAKVDVDHLKKDLEALNILYQRVKQPRVMVVIPETHTGRRSSDFNLATETEVIRQLIQKGIQVVDQKQTQRVRETDQMRRVLNGDKDAARLIGLQYDAEILIVGEASSEAARPDKTLGDMVSSRARLVARAFQADTGEILTAGEQTAAGLDISDSASGQKARAEVARQWFESTWPFILERWEKEAAATSTIRLVVEGVTLRQLIQLEEFLRAQIGAKDIRRRSFDQRVAVLELDVKSTGQALANELVHRNPEGFEMEVKTFSPRNIDLRVRQR